MQLHGRDHRTKLPIHGQRSPIKAREAALSTKLDFQLQLTLLYLTPNYQRFPLQNGDKCRVKNTQIQAVNDRTRMNLVGMCPCTFLTKHVQDFVVRGSIASSDGRDHRTPPFIAAQRPHPLIYEAVARSRCINLPTGSKTRDVVAPIGAMQLSDNVGCPIIDWLLYFFEQTSPSNSGHPRIVTALEQQWYNPKLFNKINAALEQQPQLVNAARAHACE